MTSHNNNKLLCAINLKAEEEKNATIINTIIHNVLDLHLHQHSAFRLTGEMFGEKTPRLEHRLGGGITRTALGSLGAEGQMVVFDEHGV